MIRTLLFAGACIALAACTDRVDHVGGVQFDDCSASRHSARCESYPTVNGAVGSGVMWQVPVAELQGGFVDGTDLVLAVREGPDDSETPGNVYAIDWLTGDRRLVSGVYQDPRYGDEPVGSGPSLNGIVDVRAWNGAWFASTLAGIVRIDPSTGDRTLVFDAHTPSDCATVSRAGIAIDDDGTIFTAGRTADFSAAVVAITPGACRVVSVSGSDGIGNGPAFARPEWFAIDRGVLYVADPDSASILSVDPHTGDRVRVSSANPLTRVGDGEVSVGEHPISVDGDGLWTSGSDGAPVRVDVTSGDRVEVPLHGGPATSGGDSVAAVWAHPNFPLLIEAHGHGVVVVNRLTGESNWLSR